MFIWLEDPQTSTSIIVKYNASGVWQWTKSHETGPNVYFANLTISAHSDGVVLNCKISDGTYEGYAPNFDTRGSVTWQYRFDNDYELTIPTVIGTSAYSTDDDSRVHKVPLTGLTTSQTTEVLDPQAQLHGAPELMQTLTHNQRSSY